MGQTKSKDGICRLEQKGGKTLAWSMDSNKKLIQKDGFYFKDLEGTGELLPFEDWRLTPWERAVDLSQRMTIEELAGLMLYSPHQIVPFRKDAPFKGTYDGKAFEDTTKEPYELSDQQIQFLEKEKIRHILVMTVKDAETSARWSNELQKKVEKLPHGIPVNISSDPRNGAKESKAEFKSGGSDVSKWPEGMGFAACFDENIVKQFAQDASREYRALGITTALGPQIDLATEPRWLRFADTLGIHTESVISMTKAYCDGMQTTIGTSDGWGKESVNTMVKHWPGGGTGEGGRDAHYAFGQYAVYPSNNFEEHLKPFIEGAFKLEGPTKAASAVMPYYTVSWDIDKKNLGNAYSEYIIKDLLREKYNYQGVVCTDWGITQDPSLEIDFFGSRCFGVNQLSEAERCLMIIMNGVDQFGGNNSSAPIIDAYHLGCKKYGESIMRKRMELSGARLLKNIFQCGLFEDPYLNPEESANIVGCKEFCDHGYEAQRKSIIMLKNKENILPLKKGIKIYTPKRKIRKSKGFFRQDIDEKIEIPITQDDINKYGVLVDTPEEADVALVFIESPTCNPYIKEDCENGGNGYFPISLQYRPYQAKDAREISIAGGDFREKFTNRSYFNKMTTIYNEQDLDNIIMCREKMGNKPVIVCAHVLNPMVMHEFESISDGIFLEFGVTKNALLDLVFGEYSPTAKLPFHVPVDMETVEKHCEDCGFDIDPYCDSLGNVYEYGFGLTY